MRATVAIASVSVKSLGGEIETQGSPVVREDETQPVGAQRPVLVGEPDAAVELRLARLSSPRA